MLAVPRFIRGKVTDTWGPDLTLVFELGWVSVSSPSNQQPRTVRFGAFEVDLQSARIWKSGRLLKMQYQPFQVLATLVDRPGEVVTREELRQKLWPMASSGDFNHGLNNAINRLREVLCDCAESPAFIETLPRCGYRFLAAVHRPLPSQRIESVVKHLEDVPASDLIQPGSTQHREQIVVGRELELAKLINALLHASESRGRVLFVTGEPGMGKSTLVDEFIYLMQNQHPTYIAARGHCIEQYGTGEAYGPFLDALAGLLFGPHRELVARLLQTYAPTWCLQFPAVFNSPALLEQLRAETIGATKQRMLREMGDMLEALATNRTLVIWLEDLHEADAPSIDLLRYLSGRIGNRALLIIGTFRPAELNVRNHPLNKHKLEMEAHNQCEEIRLPCLTEDAICVYLNLRFAPNDFAKESAKIIYGKTAGHPLFATSLAQFLAESGALATVAGQWKLTLPLATIGLDIPENVRSMIHKQIEMLSHEEGRILQHASVEGEEFTSTVLARLLECDELWVEERLATIEKTHRLIQRLAEEELPDGTVTTKYRFAHALYQNLIYETVLTRRRALLHRRAGEELLREYGEQNVSVASKLAMHFELCRDYVKAIEFLIVMGDNARGMFENAAAVMHYTKCLGLVHKTPSAQRAAKELELHYKRGSAFVALGQLSDAEAAFSAMLRGARASGRTHDECVALNALANAYMYAHRVDEMGVCAAEGLKTADAIGDPALRSEAMSNCALLHLVSGELHPAKVLFDEAIPIARSTRHMPALLPSLIYRGLHHFFVTEYTNAEALEAEAAGLAIEARDGFHLANALFYLGLSLGNQGRVSEALGTLHRAHEMARRNGNQLTLSRVPNGVGWLYRELYDTRTGLEHDSRGVQVARINGRAEAEANSLINLVYDYLQAGESESALVSLKDVEPLTDRDPWNRWRFFDIRFHAAAAELWLCRKNLDLAYQHATELLGNASHHNVPKYMCIAHKLLGQVHFAAGEHERAAFELRTALNYGREHPAPLVTWKVDALLARALGCLGDISGMQATFSSSAETINTIASHIGDTTLKQTFLDSDAVQAVFVNCRAAS